VRSGGPFVKALLLCSVGVLLALRVFELNLEWNRVFAPLCRKGIEVSFFRR
jgi:hypothetical protein